MRIDNLPSLYLSLWYFLSLPNLIFYYFNFHEKKIDSFGVCFSTVEVERIITEAQGVVYYGAHTLSQLVGSYKCPTLSKNGKSIKI